MKQSDNPASPASCSGGEPPPASARFLNADLEIFSDQDLQPLIDEIGERAYLLYGGPFSDDFPFMASFEIDHDPETKVPEALVLAYCDLVGSLSPENRALWDSARERVIDLGYEVTSGADRATERFSPETLRRMADLDIHLAWTFYPADEDGPARQAIGDGTVAS